MTKPALVSEIALILSKNPVLFDLKLFGDRLNINPGDLAQILLAFRREDKSTYEAFNDILCKWIQSSGESQLLSELLDVLEVMGHIRLKEELSQTWPETDTEIHLPKSSQGTFLFNITKPVPYFIGRDREIQKVKELLEEHSLVAITGPRGIGKSELAKAIVDQYVHLYSAVFWMNAECWDELSTSWTNLALALNITAFGATELNLAEMIYRLQQEKKVLFIFDGNSPHVAQFLPNAGISSAKFLMVSDECEIKQNCVQLETLQEEDAVQLVKTLSDISSGQLSHVKELVKELSCFPLALAEAVRLIKEQQIHQKFRNPDCPFDILGFIRTVRIDLNHPIRSIIPLRVQNFGALCEEDLKLYRKEERLRSRKRFIRNVNLCIRRNFGLICFSLTLLIVIVPTAYFIFGWK